MRQDLRFACDLPDSRAAHDIHESIKRGDISEYSFAFRAVADRWTDAGKKRELRDVDLFDVSPVTYPAYSATSVSARDLAQLGDVRTGYYRMADLARARAEASPPQRFPQTAKH
jgi:uncharacterized protein